MNLNQFNTVVSLSRKYLIQPHTVDEICYTLFKMFKDNAASIVYEKPSCSHVFIVSSGYEIRLFITSSYELHLNLIFELSIPFSAISLKNIHKLFNDIDKNFSRLCKYSSEIQVSLRTTSNKINKINLDKLIYFLSGIGIVVESREKHSMENITISILRGKTIGRNLKIYNVTVTILHEETSEITLTIETSVENNDNIISQLIEIQNFVYNVIEYLFNYVKKRI